MSQCDNCPQPGYCCRSVRLNGGIFGKEIESNLLMEIWLEAWRNDPKFIQCNISIPFHPLHRDAAGWWFWCENLDIKTGRCNDYLNRPVACRQYEPASDKLCVLYKEIENALDA